MANERIGRTGSDTSDVRVIITATGADQYRIVATATFDSELAEVWALLWDWQRFVAVGLPGLTSGFTWLSGGPDHVPSTFQFEAAGALLKEQIYERAADLESGRHCLRYRVLEPALGVLEYDAVLELQSTEAGGTAYSATRDVRLTPGTGPDMLAGMVESETRCLKQYFAV